MLKKGLSNVSPVLSILIWYYIWFPLRFITSVLIFFRAPIFAEKITSGWLASMYVGQAGRDGWDREKE